MGSASRQRMLPGSLSRSRSAILGLKALVLDWPLPVELWSDMGVAFGPRESLDWAPLFRSQFSRCSPDDRFDSSVFSTRVGGTGAGGAPAEPVSARQHLPNCWGRHPRLARFLAPDGADGPSGRHFGGGCRQGCLHVLVPFHLSKGCAPFAIGAAPSRYGSRLSETGLILGCPWSSEKEAGRKLTCGESSRAGATVGRDARRAGGKVDESSMSVNLSARSAVAGQPGGPCAGCCCSLKTTAPAARRAVTISLLKG